MNKKDIEYKITDLKDEYIQLQNNIEKLEYVGGNIAPLEKRLTEIEKELQSLNQMLNNTM